MKKIILVLTFLLGSVNLFSFEIQGFVIAVSDGDTLTILVKNSKYRIRLYGIDCPEKRQAFGIKATNFTKNFCLNKQAVVYIKGTDKYQRTIGEVFINGISLNRALVKNGLAWWYYIYAPDDSNLQELETNAKEKKLGLWEKDNPIAPWEFRRKK